MEYRRLGASGLKVSPLGLGTSTFGRVTSDAVARRIIDSAFDAGVNLIDTSDSYSRGKSEISVGKLIAKQRDRWVLCTKVRNRMTEGDPNSGGLGRKWIMYEVDASLRRLKTDYIDIYFLHRDDADTPLEETLTALSDLIRAGKIRYSGLSNFRGWRIAEAVNTCSRLGLPRPVAVEPYYNAMTRHAEVEILPACQYYGLGVITYSPLARGVLTGKYVPGKKAAPTSRVGRKDKRMAVEFRAESLKYAQIIKAHAEKSGMSGAQFALNWVLNNKLVTAVLAGPRTLPQWHEYVAAFNYKLDASDEALVDRLVAPGHPSTPGFTNPKDPVTGRIPAHG